MMHGHNLGMSWGWCPKSLCQKVAVVTLSLTVVAEASESKGKAGLWDFTPG